MRCRRPRLKRTRCSISRRERQIFESVLREQRGALLVAGHFGNWEIGGVLMGRVLKLPLTIVAMPEADPAINALRRETRDRMGVETLEVRQSLETPLAIRRTLAANRVVAFLVDRHVGRDRIEVSFFGRRDVVLADSGAVGVSDCRADHPVFSGARRTWPIYDRRAPANRRRSHASARCGDPTGDAANGHRAGVSHHAQTASLYHFYSYWDAQDAASQPTR